MDRDQTTTRSDGGTDGACRSRIRTGSVAVDAAVMHRDHASERGDQARVRLAQPSSGAGHQDDLILEIDHRSIFSSHFHGQKRRARLAVMAGRAQGPLCDGQTTLQGTPFSAIAVGCGSSKVYLPRKPGLTWPPAAMEPFDATLPR
jgi:hypothetical protein